MAEKRKLIGGGFEASPVVSKSQATQNNHSGFSFGSPVEKSPDLFSGHGSLFCQNANEQQQEKQQRQNNPSPSGFLFRPQEQQQSQRNKTINISPSFCFYGDEQRQNKSPLVINDNTSPFGEQQKHTQSTSLFHGPGFLFQKDLGTEMQQGQEAQYNSELHARIERRKPIIRLGKSMIKQTHFSLSLAKHVISTTEAKDANFVFSPLSMHVVLSMVAAGSAGPTRAQFLGFLKSKSVEELNSLSSQVSTLLFADGGPVGGPRLSFANGVWVDKSLTLKPAFKEVVDKDYRAASNLADFKQKAEDERKQVNSWADKETNGLIKDLLPPGSVDDKTRLVLANALYFKGVWADKFDATLTEDKDFFLLDGTNSVRAPFMTSRKAKHAVGAFDGFKVLVLPYGQGDDNRSFSMFIYLPDARDGLPALLDRFGSDPYFIIKHLPGRSVVSRNFRVPKFKIGFGFEATKVLKGHGLDLPFSPGGLTEMVEKGGEELCITSFYHKACIEVDEQGTEAAAASACFVGVSDSKAPKPQVDFVADHPFLFVVREDVSGGVIFAGQLLNPIAA